MQNPERDISKGEGELHVLDSMVDSLAKPEKAHHSSSKKKKESNYKLQEKVF